MLYNGSEVIRDLEWVIFDEVHYINDAEVRSPTPVGFACFFTSLTHCSVYFFPPERSRVGGGFNYAPGPRQHHPPQRYGAKRHRVQRVDRVSAPHLFIIRGMTNRNVFL